jgi:hypothetical protein
VIKIVLMIIHQNPPAMKNLLLLFTAVLICFAAATPQSCLPEGIIFSTQEQIDNFQTNYPECTEIEGDVTIQGAGITNLDGLSVLASIGGKLEIRANSSLGSLVGLESLISIGGYFLIQYNSSLLSLTGLEDITFVGGDLTIIGNTALSSCNADWLCNVPEIVSGSVTIQNNAQGCASLVEAALSCGGMACLPNGIHNFISQNDVDNFSLAFPGCHSTESVTLLGNINNLNGLSVLTTITGNLEIRSNSTLVSLAGLEGLNSVGGDLRIYDNPLITNLTGLDNLTFIGGSLELSRNTSLSTCNNEWFCDLLQNTGGVVEIFSNASGCQSVIDVAYACGGIPCLTHGNYVFYSQNDVDNFSMAFPDCSELAGSVTISGADINNLHGLNILSSIDSNLIIGISTSLKNLNGLGNLTSIGGELRIWGNYLLDDLIGLDNLTSIGGDLNVGFSLVYHTYGNSLTSLTGLGSLVSIGGNLSIIANNGLTTLSGLENIIIIGDKLYILKNESLTSLTGLGTLANPINELVVIWNSSLTSLAGLEGLPSVNGNITIWENPSLTSLVGLDSIAAGSIANLNISNNTSLSTCAVTSICDYLVAPNGTVLIENNAPGCNSPEEVIEACESSSIEVIGGEDGFNVFPSPFTNQLNIEFTLDQPCRIVVTVYNNMGRLAAKPAEKELQPGKNQLQWDNSKLPSGIYLLHLQVGQKIITRKIIKY